MTRNESRQVGTAQEGTREPGVDHVYADSPEAAARIWLWRLSEMERKVTVRLAVFAPKPHAVIEGYSGPPVRFARRDGRLIKVGS